MDPEPRDHPVEHNQAESRFEVRVGGQLCVADYALRGGEMVMTHTFVPPELRGRGLAEKLVRAACEYACQQQYRIVPACSYVAVFLRRHPEYQSLVN